MLYFDLHAEDGKVHVCNKFLSVRQPKRANAEGIFECFGMVLGHVGITNWESKLVGFSCDGASVNIGAYGLKGRLEGSVPWVVVSWCLAHRPELALKDALKGTVFSTIYDMLLRAYYLYENRQKNATRLMRWWLN